MSFHSVDHSMVTRQQLLKSRNFLKRLHQARTSNKVKQVLTTATVTELRVLLNLIRDILIKKIPLQKRHHKNRLRTCEVQCRFIVANFKELYRANRRQIFSALCTIVTIIRIFVLPLFDCDSPPCEEVDEGGAEEDLEPLEDISELDEPSSPTTSSESDFVNYFEESSSEDESEDP